MTSSPEITAWWQSEWAREVAEQEQRSGTPAAQWRAAGRKTKDKPDAESAAFWAEEGLRQVQTYADWLAASDWTIATFNDQPLVEFSLSGMFAGIPVKGYVDVVFDSPSGWIVADYKSGSRDPAGPQQLALYAVMLADLGMPTPEWGAFFNTRKGELGPVESLSQWDKAWWEKQFSRLAVAREHEIYLPHVSDMCRGCGVRKFCYAVGGLQAHLYDPDHPNYGNSAEKETV
jgi:RecB family exonuclease